MTLNRRSFITHSAALATVAAASTAHAAPESGALSEEDLGNMLAAMGLKPKKTKSRYDFNFKAVFAGEEWVLSMSTVLSQNGGSIWSMAWLDELPRSASDVPRTALLRLLAQNDRLGNGKFFAYIASNRRFVLQRVVENQGLTTASFQEVLKDLGASVVETYPHWSVENWKSGGSTVPESGSDRSAAAPSARTSRQ